MFSVDLTRVVVQEGFLPGGCCPLHAQRGSHLGCNPGSSYLEGAVTYMLSVDLTRVVVQEAFPTVQLVHPSTVTPSTN